jgi:hypothetical protein
MAAMAGCICVCFLEGFVGHDGGNDQAAAVAWLLVVAAAAVEDNGGISDG